MRVLVGFLCAGLSAALPGQGVVPPIRIGPQSPQPGLNPGSVPAASVRHVHMVHLPGDPPNVFYCAATVTGLSGALGGAGNTDLLCGSYDVLTDTFTPNNEAAALNSTMREFAMTVHHSGLHAVFDRLTFWPWLARRTAVGQPWQIVGPIMQNSPQAWYYPALADHHGQTFLLYGLHTTLGIVMQPIDLNTAQLTGPPTVIVDPITSWGSRAEAPIPITDSSGELLGVSHGYREGPYDSNDHWLSLDLDPATPPVLMHDAALPATVGGFVGGRFFDTEAQAPFRVLALDTFWFTGGRAPVGGAMEVRIFSPPTAGPHVYFSLFAASTAFGPAGRTLPPAQGFLGIDLASSWASPLVLHDNRNGEASVSFPIPNVPALSGVRLPAQSATYQAATTAGLWLGNTAVLVVE